MLADDQERLSVWHALSDLFLDTELQDEDYRSIADVLRRSGYSRETLRAILETEVLPAFASNLMGVAGEWAPWTEGEVRAIMGRSLGRPRIARAVFDLIPKCMFGGYVRREWGKIEARLDAGTGEVDATSRRAPAP